MAGGRGKLPVIAEISAPRSGDDRVWTLRREDFDRLEEVLRRVEGRTTVLVSGEEDLLRVVAVGVAGAASAAGRSAILVECDLTRPRLAADLGLAQSPGLHEYLRWEATAAEILQPLALAGPAASSSSEPLACVSAGRLAPDSRTLLGLQSFRHMNAKLRRAYELVVLVGPAIAADPAGLETIAAEADGVLLGISASESKRRAQKSLRAAVTGLPAAAIGAVVVG